MKLQSNYEYVHLIVFATMRVPPLVSWDFAVIMCQCTLAIMAMYLGICQCRLFLSSERLFTLH